MDSNKKKLLIGSNWITKYKADLILSKNKLKFQMQGKRFEIKIVNALTRKLSARMNWFKEN